MSGNKKEDKKKKKEEIAELKKNVELCGCGYIEKDLPGQCLKTVGWNNIKKCWNKFACGHHRRGKILSDKTKRKISNARKGKTHSEETKKKMGVSRENHYLFGKHHLEETKKKISKATSKRFKNKKEKSRMSELLKNYHKENPGILRGKNHYLFGKHHSEETRRKMSESQIGKQHSERTKKKLSKIFKNPSREQRIKMSCIRQGISLEQWDGFISAKPYCDAWLDKEYKQSIRDRDNNQCQNCGKLMAQGGKKLLCLHHIDYDKKNCHPNNLITLCGSCNIIANYNRNYWKDYYLQIINIKGL